MTWTSVAAIVLRVTLILAAAAAVSLLLRRSSAAARHLVWTVAIAASLVVPAISSTLPHWNVRVLPSMLEQPLRVDITLASRVAPAARRGAPIPAAKAGPAPTRPEAPAQYSLLGLASVVWAAGVLIVLLWLAVGTARMQWIARRARPVHDASWVELAEALAGLLGIRAPVLFLEGTSAAMPMTWGIFRHRVLLPHGAGGWPLERQKVVLLHELAHVKRRDCFTQLLAQIACAVYWFNPLAWLAARRLRTERERACDDLVLSAGTRGSEYADHLLDIARSLRDTALPTWTAVAMAHRSQLEGRLMAILDPGMIRRTPTRRAAVALGAAFTMFAVLVALVTPLARPALAAGAPVAQASTPPAPDVRRQSLPTPTPAPVPAPAPSRSPAPRTLGAEIANAITEAVSDAITDVISEVVTGGLRGGVRGGVLGGIRGGVPGGVEGGVRTGGQSSEANPKVVAALAEALKDTDAEVRKQALMTLARVGAKEAVEPLRAATKNADPEVRQQAVFALGQYGDPANYEYFAAALGDANASVAEQGAFALGQLDDKRAIGPLTKALKSSPSSDVRQQAAFALGQFGDGSAVDALVAALRDDCPTVREQAAFALGQIGDARATDALMAALKDQSAQVRRQAAFALSQVTK